VVVLICVVEDVSTLLAQAHECSAAMPHDGMADTGKKAGFRAADLVEPLVEVIGRDFGTPERIARVAMGNDKNTRGVLGHCYHRMLFTRRDHFLSKLQRSIR
jgi:hypothetical protein